MTTFRIDVTRNDHSAEFERIFTDAANAKLPEAMKLLKETAEALSPVYLETFRNSYGIFYTPDGNMRFTAELVNSAPHAGVVEGIDAQGNETPYGRRPGVKGPPLIFEPGIRKPQVKTNILVFWVRKVLGIASPSQSRGVAYIIARRMKAQGIKPSRPSKRAAELREAEINRMLDEELPALVEAKL